MNRFKILRYLIGLLLFLVMNAALFMGFDNVINHEGELFNQFILVVIALFFSVEDMLLGKIHSRSKEEIQPEYNNFKRMLLSSALLSMLIGLIIYIVSPILDELYIKTIQLFFVISIISSLWLLIYRFVRK